MHGLGNIRKIIDTPEKVRILQDNRCCFIVYLFQNLLAVDQTFDIVCLFKLNLHSLGLHRSDNRQEELQADDPVTGGVSMSGKDLRLSIGGLQILSGITFEVKLGEILALIGLNGSGKTSLINCVSGFYRV